MANSKGKNKMRDSFRKVGAILSMLAVAIVPLTGCDGSGLSSTKNVTVSDKKKKPVVVKINDCKDAASNGRSIDSSDELWDPNNYGSREEYIEGTKEAVFAICEAINYKWPSTFYATMFFEGGMTWSDGKFNETKALKAHTLFGICCSDGETGEKGNWKYWDGGCDGSIRAGNGMCLRLYSSYKNSAYDYFAWLYRNSGYDTPWNGKKYDSYLAAMNDGSTAQEAIALRNCCGYCNEGKDAAMNYASQALGCVKNYEELDKQVSVSGEPKNIEEVETSGIKSKKSSGSSGGSKSGGSSVLTGDSVQEQCWNYLKDQGLSDIAAAAVMGNIQGECGFNCELEGNLDGRWHDCERNIGFFQFTHVGWNPPPDSPNCTCEYCAYKRWAGSEKLNGAKQLQWAFEGAGEEQGVWQNRWMNREGKYARCDSYRPTYSAEEFVDADNIERATYSWMASYEGPDYNDHNIEDRITAAKEFYEQFKGTHGSGRKGTAEACEDKNGNQKYGNSGVGEGDKYHQGQGLHYPDSNTTTADAMSAGQDSMHSDAQGAACGAYSVVMGVNMLLGEVHKFCGAEIWKNEFGGDSTGVTNGNQVDDWLKKENLDGTIEIVSKNEMSTGDDIANALEDDCVVICSAGKGSDEKTFYDNTGEASAHPKGHYLCWYKIEGDKYYANDPGRWQTGAGCAYTKEQLDKWIQTGSAHGSIVLKRK